MMNRRPVNRGFVILLAMLLSLLPTTDVAAAAAAAEVRVMSFNIRYATPRDIPTGNAWPTRKALVLKTIEAFAPDLAGLQEVLPTQGEEIKAHFAATHDFIGVPRTDGKTAGEMVPVLFRRARFEKVREGTFWLSETPDVVGSKGWDADLPRIVTWVELRDRKHDNRRVLFLNTHFDHLGKQARMESAKLMRKRMLELGGGDGRGGAGGGGGGDGGDGGEMAIIATGDFNVPQYSPPYKELLGDADAKPRLIETFKEANPKPTTQDYTYHGFIGQNTRADRIDWVLRSEHFKTLKASIDRTNENGRYPSDHYPITAVLEWK